MRLDKIINSPQARLKQILETLKKEFAVEMDFSSSKSLKSLVESAVQTQKTIRKQHGFNTQHASPQMTCAALIIEAARIYEAELIEIKKIAEGKGRYLNKPKMKKKKVNESNEIDKAELLLASKSIVDDLQKIIQTLSKIQIDQLPVVIDKIKAEHGLEVGNNYRDQSVPSIQEAITSVSNAREMIDNLTMGLSGDVDMTSHDMLDNKPAEPSAPMEPEPAGQPELDIDGLDTEMPAERERKEETAKNVKPVITEKKSVKEAVMPVGNAPAGSNSQQQKNSDQQKQSAKPTVSAANVKPQFTVGQKAKLLGKDVTVSSDVKGAMIGVQDIANGPTRMVPMSQLKAYEKANGLVEDKDSHSTSVDKKLEKIKKMPTLLIKAKLANPSALPISQYYMLQQELACREDSKIEESHSNGVKPTMRQKRIAERALERYSHEDFLEMAHARLSNAAAKDLSDVLDGHSYQDQDRTHLEAIASFAESKGEFALANDIKDYLDGDHAELKEIEQNKTYYVVKVKEASRKLSKFFNIQATDTKQAVNKAIDLYNKLPVTHTPTARMGIPRAAVVKAFTDFNSAEKYKNQVSVMGAQQPTKVVVETRTGTRKFKIFESQDQAKLWITQHGHNFRNITCD